MGIVRCASGVAEGQPLGTPRGESLARSIRVGVSDFCGKTFRVPSVVSAVYQAIHEEAPEEHIGDSREEHQEGKHGG